VKSKKIILGTVQLGLDYGINNPTGQPSLSESLDILNEALDQGISTLDTAQGYGNASEVIGKFHQQSERKFKVNTKFRVDKQNDFSTKVQESLDLLQVSTIGVYFYHHFDDLIKYPGILNDLNKLKENGLISKIGVSIYDSAQFEVAVFTEGIDTIQMPFNLLDNYFQRGKQMMLAKKKNKEIQVRSVFLQGLFFKDSDTYPEYLEPLKQPMNALRQLALEANLSMQELAMAYVFSKAEIDQIIIGVDNKEQLKTNLALSEILLPASISEKIDQLAVRNVELLYPYNWK